MNTRLIGARALTACLAAAGCETTSPGYGPGYASAPPPGSACYNDCGTVTRIEVISGGSSLPNATGAVVGAVVGAAAGRELADDLEDGVGVAEVVLGGIREGSYVRIYNGRAWAR